MPDGTDGGRPDSDDIDRRLRELTEEINKSRLREPSHQERLAAAPKANKRARRKTESGLLTIAIVVVVLVLAAGGTITWARLHHVSWLRLGPNHPSPTAQAAPKPVLTPTVVSGPPSDPFAGTPADGWANGANGITIPAAVAHGPFTAAEVSAAYAKTRELVIAGNLDWPTLRGGYPGAFAKLLIPQERSDFLDGLTKTGPDKQGFPAGTRDWVASFVPGSTEFVTTAVKVHGWMSASEASDHGTRELRITVNYLFTYAVEPPRAPGDWMRVVDHEQGSVDFAQWTDPGGALQPWFEGASSAAGALCGTMDGYIHPDFPQGPPSTAQPSGSAVDPYSLATTAPGGHYTCQRLSRGT